LGVSFIGWLKVLSLPLFILTGILCYILFPHLKDPSEAYMTMVTSLFPPGMNGLVIVVLIAVLVGTIGSSLNALSTVFTMDIYVKKINPKASNQQIIKMGRVMVVVGCVFAVGMALAIDSIKGLNLFDIFQSVLGFIAPPLAVVFLLTVFWKRTSRKAVNFVLSGGSILSLGTGVMYLWVLPAATHPFWPHYLMLSFLIFAGLTVLAVLISVLDPSPQVYVVDETEQKPVFTTTNKVKLSWVLLSVVMVGLYLYFR
jgi:SSS family solute:Na+ symporter